ncbi:MAG: RagB/SusD family nutrient uptake outer membrane protein [Prolixibacteraceae bacterium]|jgi:hypothetical protein|nr:RagB/SusD family nutrient uptake outer membrane protein [Prolixibacteraceae bacterium]
MKSTIFLFIILLFFVSCENLEITPSNRLSDETVFSNPINADMFLCDIYNDLNAGPYTSQGNDLPSGISNDPCENFTDNTCYGPTAGNPSFSLFNSSSYNPANTLFNNQWRHMYRSIRKCNLFIEKVTASTFDEDTKTGLLAQARFLRAYYYKSLIELYGGVPIITKVLRNDVEGEDIFYPRNSYEECVGFIQTECTAAAGDLPQTVSGANLGRATKGAALALKGSMELYAGKWAEAAATNKQIMDMNVYKLFPDYGDLFYAANENNQEVIFDIQFAPEVKRKRINQFWGAVMVQKGAGWGSCCPTQNLIDCYEFKDGLTEAEGSSLFNPDNPYQNRDNRFYESIIYDGSTWRGEKIYTRLGIANNANEINVTNKSGNAGRTGYFIKKLQDSTIYSTNSMLDGTNFIVFRYAEILLNYAEAKNETSGPDQTVYDAVNQVRKRAGQPDLPTGLTKEQMRSKIRNERRVELAFEQKYFFDIIRWKTAEQIFSIPVTGMKISTKNGNLVYEKIPIRTVIFSPSKNYLQPIPQSVMDVNPELVQNPGY